MTMTRAQAEAALKHVLSSVLQLEDDHDIVKSLTRAGCNRIDVFLCMDENNIQSLGPADGSTLLMAHQILISSFLIYVDNRERTEGPIGDMTKVTAEEFAKF